MLTVDVDLDNAEGDRGKMLVAAVIQQAIHDLYYVRHTRASGHATDVLRGESKEWIFSKDDPTGTRPFSFEWCCLALDRDPVKCRMAIRKRMFMKRWA